MSAELGKARMVRDAETLRRLRSLACVSLVALSRTADPEEHAASHGKPARPSIVLIVIDTLRADFVGAYGFEGELTPISTRSRLSLSC